MAGTQAPRVLIAQLGLGGVGQALVRQHVEWSERQPERRWLGYAALADRSGLCLLDREGGWSVEELDRALACKRAGNSLEELAGSLGEDARFTPAARSGLPSLGAVWSRQANRDAQIAVVDVTAERGAYDTLLDARRHDAHVVMCNKWTLAESSEHMDEFLTAGHGKVLYETTVGAALPVIGVLDGLLKTGDEVAAIEAAISGTMGFVCSEIERGTPFSQALKEAQKLGYTEPDRATTWQGSMHVARPLSSLVSSGTG